MKPKAYSYTRFSTPEQAKGDSQRRQIEAAKKYAEENSLDLDEELEFIDHGISAYSGKNRMEGALGNFHDLIADGTIKEGSFLIVESLDRLSREQVDDAYDQFRVIIKAGITIVTLHDKSKYNRESLKNNWVQLIISIIIMARAHEESLAKSIRSSAYWAQKRKLAAVEDIKMTSRCPAWLTLAEDKKEFIVNKKAKEAINLIFDLRKDNKGKHFIAKYLNQENYWKPPGRHGKAPNWGPSYIQKLLHNDRRLIGEFQPHKIENGKRIKKGDPIPNYFPTIINEEKFMHIQALIKQNFEAGKEVGYYGGKTGSVNNLFSPLAICIQCGYKMVYINKGSTSKGGEYFVCQKELNKIKGGCSSKKVKYSLVEENVLNYCLGLKKSDIVPSKVKELSKLSKLHDQELVIDFELSEIKKQIEKLPESILKAKTQAFQDVLIKTGDVLSLKIENLEAERERNLTQQNQLNNATKSTKYQLKDLKDLISMMGEIKGDERSEFRLRLRNQLRRLIRRIKVSDVAVIIFFKSGVRRMVRYDNSQEYLKYFDKFPAKDVELSKAGKLPDEVGPGMYRTKFKKKSK